MPDNQEVYLSSTGLSSILFDVTERVCKPSDEAALKFHLDDIIEESDIATTWAFEREVVIGLP